MTAAPLQLECSIAQISDLFSLTPRAIRHYEDQGLVRPRRDALNRRRYGPVARARLQLIAKLRRAGLGLEEIRALLDLGQAAPERQATIICEAVEARLVRLDVQMDECRQLLADLSPAPVAAQRPQTRAVHG